MTLPIGSFDPDNLPQGVYGQDELGEVLQNSSAPKYRSLFAGRFPGAVAGTSAGDPSNVGGPLGFIVNLVAQFMSGVANEDPANITKPDDLLSRISGFFTLPALANAALQAVLIPLSHLLAWIVGGEPKDWDTLEELRDNLIPALIRLPIRIIVNILGSVPIIGGIIEEDFAAWLGVTNANATAAAVTANRALALAQAANSGGMSASETFEGSGALDSTKWTVAASRVQRVNGDLGITTQTGDGNYADWAVYKPEYTSDNQSAAVVLGAGGSTSLASSLFIRCNADATRFVYLNFFKQKFYLGQGSRSGGNWTWNDWVMQDFEVNAGYSIALQVVGNLYTVTINGQTILSYPDTGSTAPVGAAYRHAGVKIEQTRLFFTNTRSHHIRAFAMADV